MRLYVSTRLLALVAGLVLLLGSTTTAYGITLFLNEDDPQNLSNFRISVRVSDGIITVIPISEFVWLADGGNGTLEFEQVGILEPKYELMEIGFQYDAGDFFESVVPTPSGDIPISLTVDEARFHLRNADGSPLGHSIALGSLGPFGADELVANFRGNVTFAGIVFPFDFYDPVWDCPGDRCFELPSGSTGDPRWFLDAIDSIEITGSEQGGLPPERSGFPARIKPPPESGNLGEVGGLFVSVTVGSQSVERQTYTSPSPTATPSATPTPTPTPEPGGLAALGSGIAMLAVLYRRRAWHPQSSFNGRCAGIGLKQQTPQNRPH